MIPKKRAVARKETRRQRAGRRWHDTEKMRARHGERCQWQNLYLGRLKLRGFSSKRELPSAPREYPQDVQLLIHDGRVRYSYDGESSHQQPWRARVGCTSQNQRAIILRYGLDHTPQNLVVEIEMEIAVLKSPRT